VNRRALERHLRQHGCRSVGEGARHSKWRGPTGAAATIPRHRELRLPTALAICKQLGVPRRARAEAALPERPQTWTDRLRRVRPRLRGAYRLPTTNSDPRRPPEPLDLEAEIAEEHRERPPGEEPQVR
jgi:hypothetical protein